jgi:DNA-binding transcriptional MocR family regulator
MDEEGALPDAIEAAHRPAPLKAADLQSTINNPRGATMGPIRRQAIASVLQRTGIICAEDTVYAARFADIDTAAFLKAELTPQ